VILDLGGEIIRVTVVQIKGSQIRVGIEAPEYIPVLREELYEQTRKSRKANANNKRSVKG
jgi:carbon storage regulator